VTGEDDPERAIARLNRAVRNDSSSAFVVAERILPWLKQRDVALIVWETAASPQPAGDLFRNAVHNFVQAILGIQVLDRADLEALGEATASCNRWEFMLTVNPLALPNATGSPVNPIACSERAAQGVSERHPRKM
jgi:hypothetical protein